MLWEKDFFFDYFWSLIALVVQLDRISDFGSEG